MGDAEHMRDIVVQETLEDIDKDGDGHVNIDEYIGDMYRDEGGEEGEHEPDWVASEREQFTQFRDTDGNGLMDLEEVKVWMESSLKWSWIMRRIVWLQEVLPNFLHRPGSFHQTLTTAKQRPSTWCLSLM